MKIRARDHEGVHRHLVLSYSQDAAITGRNKVQTEAAEQERAIGS
jgi:hypothetical protein